MEQPLLPRRIPLGGGRTGLDMFSASEPSRVGATTASRFTPGQSRPPITAFLLIAPVVCSAFAHSQSTAPVQLPPYRLYVPGRARAAVSCPRSEP